MKFAAVAAALLALSCAEVIRRPPPPHPPRPPLYPSSAESCDRAEETLLRIGCRREDGTSWAQTPKGATFSEACKSALKDGRDWNARCIAMITQCEELTDAFRGTSPLCNLP
jgi:hypothetical protein